VKRTAGNIIDAPFFERKEIPNNLLNAAGVLYAGYGWFADHYITPDLSLGRA
jgi:hypothetical protein